MPENQTTFDCSLVGILTTKVLEKMSTRITRPVRHTTRADSEKPWQRAWGIGLTAQLGELPRRDWLKGKTETQSWLWATAGVAAVGDTSSLTWKSVGKCTREEQANFTVPSLPPPPHRQRLSTAKRVALPWWTPKAPPPYILTGVPRQRNMNQMKE